MIQTTTHKACRGFLKYSLFLLVRCVVLRESKYPQSGSAAGSFTAELRSFHENQLCGAIVVDWLIIDVQLATGDVMQPTRGGGIPPLTQFVATVCW